VLYRDTHHQEFGRQPFALRRHLYVDGFWRPFRLAVFEWLPTHGRSLAAASAELTVHTDDRPLDQDLVDVSIVIATDEAAPFGPDFSPGLLTTYTQDPYVMAVVPGAIAYDGPGVYNLGAGRNAICAGRVRLELWGSARPSRILEISGKLSLTTGIEREWRSLAHNWGGGGGPGSPLSAS